MLLLSLLWITVTAAHVGSVLSDLAWLLNRMLGTRCCCRIEESFTLNTWQWLLIVVMDSLVTSLVFWPKCLLPCCLIIVAIIQNNDADGHVLLQRWTLHKMLLVTGLLLKGHLAKTKSALFPRAESLMWVTSKRTLWPLSAWARVEMQQWSRQTLCPVYVKLPSEVLLLGVDLCRGITVRYRDMAQRDHPDILRPAKFYLTLISCNCIIAVFCFCIPVGGGASFFMPLNDIVKNDLPVISVPLHTLIGTVGIAVPVRLTMTAKLSMKKSVYTINITRGLLLISLLTSLPTISISTLLTF